MVTTLATEAPQRLDAGSSLVVMRLRLIGQMEAWTLASSSVLPSGRKTRALLAVLALAVPRPVMRARLADLLWSRRPDEQARASLRQEIHRLQDVLAPAGPGVLVVNRDSLSLRPGAAWVDVDELMHATAAHPASLALLDGELLEGMDGIDPALDTWLATERERLRGRARQVAEVMLRTQASPDATIAVAQQLLSLDRAHEEAWRALMRAHAARGERGLALQSYDRCRAALADVLDAAPAPETVALLEELRGSRPSAQSAWTSPASDAAPAPYAAPARRGAARIGIVPLAAEGGEAEARLAAGLSDALHVALVRFRWMVLVSGSAIAEAAGPPGAGSPTAGSSSGVPGGSSGAGATVGRDAALRRALGLDYVLDGSVQRAGGRMRVMLRLVDLRGNQVVWARRFDRPAEDTLAVQDEVASEAAAQLDAEVLLVEARRAAQMPAAEEDAYNLVLRAMPGMVRLERLSFARSGDLMRRALALDPSHAAAHVWMAAWQMFQISQGWAPDAAAVLADAAGNAERAVMLDPLDARGYAVAGHIRGAQGCRLPEAVALHDRALVLNPDLAMGWALSGATFAYLGDAPEAERRLGRYKRLSPLDPHAFVFDVGFCLAALVRRDNAAAALAGRAASALHPAYSAACKPYLAALGHLRAGEEAAVVLRRLLAIDPGFTLERCLAASSFERASDREHFAAGLRLAGVPEGGGRAG